MNRTTLALLAVLAPAAAIGATTKDAWKNCLDNGAGMTGCSITELDRLHPILTASYRSALALQTADRARLVTVQQAWEAYSEAACDYASSTQGKDSGMLNTFNSMARKGCLVQKTRHRIYELSAKGMRELSSQNPTSNAFMSCSNGATDLATSSKCLEAELARDDKILNATYRKSLKTAAENDKKLGVASGDERLNLIRAERRWIVFRDAQCRYLAERQSAQEPRLTDLRCRAVMTKYRTRDLSNGE